VIVADAATTGGGNALIEQVPDIDIRINNLGIYEPKNFADITELTGSASLKPMFSAVFAFLATTPAYVHIKCSKPTMMMRWRLCHRSTPLRTQWVGRPPKSC
jgi:hypothetical protein